MYVQTLGSTNILKYIKTNASRKVSPVVNPTTKVTRTLAISMSVKDFRKPNAAIFCLYKIAKVIPKNNKIGPFSNPLNERINISKNKMMFIGK
jgi:hypothetical protein